MAKAIQKIIINLNPQKASRIDIILQKVAMHTPAVGIITIMIWMLISLLQVAIFAKGYVHVGYNNKWAHWSAKAKTLKQLKDEITALETEKNKLEDVVKRQSEVSALLNDIAVAVPKNIWFDTMDLSEDSMVLHGYVLQWRQDSLASLDVFIDTLKKTSHFATQFSTITIQQSQKTNYNGVEALQFAIQCKK